MTQSRWLPSISLPGLAPRVVTGRHNPLCSDPLSHDNNREGVPTFGQTHPIGFYGRSLGQLTDWPVLITNAFLQSSIAVTASPTGAPSEAAAVGG